ncbi:hypothetical protein [Enterococcus sp. AZ180]|uniref:hypothetical protein n=1 Tax=Enterococcus sp. AZ180 TaxID=2774961 RepID=UPI003F2938C1
MKTQSVVESMLNESKNQTHLMKILRLSGILSSDREWYSKSHPELSAYVKSFAEPPHMISIKHIVNTAYFISSSDRINKNFPVIKVSGNETQVLNLSKGEIIADMLDLFRFKDFLPGDYEKQIIYVPNPEESDDEEVDSDLALLNISKNSSSQEVDGFVFTQVIKLGINSGMWTNSVDLHLSELPTFKTNPKQILKNIISEIS